MFDYSMTRLSGHQRTLTVCMHSQQEIALSWHKLKQLNFQNRIGLDCINQVMAGLFDKGREYG